MTLFNPSLSRRALLAGGGALALAGCGERQRPFFSAEAHPGDYPTTLAVEAMGRMLAERSDGRLAIRIYSGGQLGGERDTLELTMFGGIDMNRVNLAPLNSFAPDTALLSLPFLFRSVAHSRRAMDGAPGEAILESLTPHGLIGLCFYDSGERSFYTTRRPIETPADMRGLKIRVQNSDLYVSLVEGLGGNATPMDYGEVYQGLMQGVIDGAENNWPSYESSRHFEAARYFSLTNHVMAPEVLVMSARTWAGIGEADRALIRECARDSVPIMREIWDARVEASRERVIAAGVQVNEIEDLEPFADMMRPVWDRFVRTDHQRDLLAQIEQMAGE
ncbi:TRAP transporter substrate-binding protein [Glycocaulis profundi]|nr:TRAP transporter substrate-binding protein [Glycocaulis profundi]